MKHRMDLHRARKFKLNGNRSKDAFDNERSYITRRELRTRTGRRNIGCRQPNTVANGVGRGWSTMSISLFLVTVLSDGDLGAKPFVKISNGLDIGFGTRNLISRRNRRIKFRMI